jgi:superfamily II DNA/RNA helicase
MTQNIDAPHNAHPSNQDKNRLNFSDLGLAPALQTALADMGLANPTPVQREAIPHVLQGRDVLAQAQTGSGKTLTYVLPLLQQLMATAASRDAAADSAHAKTKRITQVLVLVPTRELATQVSDVLRDLARPLAQSIKVGTVFGGVSINPQMMSLRSGADVVVATPGRLLDLVDHNALNLGQVQHLVLDEADRLLDLGFAEELHLRACGANLGRSVVTRPRTHHHRAHPRTYARHCATRHSGGRKKPHRFVTSPDQNPCVEACAGLRRYALRV